MSKENSNSEESNLHEDSEPVEGAAALDWDETADLKSPLKDTRDIFDQTDIFDESDSFKSLEDRVFTRHPVARRLNIQDLESEERPLLLDTDSINQASTPQTPVLDAYFLSLCKKWHFIPARME